MYNVVIPSAGVGSRAGSTLNKALVTVGDRPVIASIIDKFPDATKIIVILGYQASYVRQALEAIYGLDRITFVETDDYTRGLGHTLAAAREELNAPFIFCANDTFVPNERMNYDPSIEGNWAAFTRHEGPNATLPLVEYRTLNVDGNQIVTGLNPKGDESSSNIYIGLAGIRDHELFWRTMLAAPADDAGESYGLRALPNVRAIEMLTWRDTGSASSIAHIKRDFASAFNVLEKEDEAIWFVNGRVIKFSVDQRFIADRVRRATNVLPSCLVPTIIQWSPNTYSYAFVEGVTLSRVITLEIFKNLFNAMSIHVWRRRPERASEVSAVCQRFYRDKTYDRIALFLTKEEVVDRPNMINGTPTPKVVDLLNAVNWVKLCDDVHPSQFHGDFHNENILLRPNGDFTLLDWRQDFGGNLTYGDAYYDWAKFLHGLIVSHDVVRHDKFLVHAVNDQVSITIVRPAVMNEIELALRDWTVDNDLDWRRVRLLTALIFLNICGLHHRPYSLFLYYLGKKMLTEVLNERAHR